jgi:acetyl esterase/lipase
VIPIVSWVVLTLATAGGLLTVTALVRADRLGWGNAFWFLSGWLTSELAMFHVAASAVIVLAFAFTPAFRYWPGQLALGVIAVSWYGLWLAQRRARPSPQVLEQALQEALGKNYRERIPAERRVRLPDRVRLGELARPFALRATDVEWLRDIAYDDDHARHRLDVYRPAGGCRGAPVLLQIHGGGWTIGNKHEQALPLIYFMAARGWVVVTPNYRLSPKARFPADYGGDPSFVAVTGGSAGGHLAALMGLTANDARLQPGFEQVDTGVAACVPFYGIYDFTDRHGLKGSGPRTVGWLAKNVMPCPPSQDPALWDLASPITLVRESAPPFFVLHGTHDSLASTAEARLFAERLRAVSRAPVAYAELPGAQHAWEIFKSARAMHSVYAVARFLEWCRATAGDVTRPDA